MPYYKLGSLYKKLCKWPAHWLVCDQQKANLGEPFVSKTLQETEVCLRRNTTPTTITKLCNIFEQMLKDGLFPGTTVRVLAGGPCSGGRIYNIFRGQGTKTVSQKRLGYDTVTEMVIDEYVILYAVGDSDLDM